MPDWLTKDQVQKILTEKDQTDKIVEIEDICAASFDDYVKDVQTKCRENSVQQEKYLYNRNTLAIIFNYLYKNRMIDDTLSNHSLFEYTKNDINSVLIPDVNNSSKLLVFEVPDTWVYNNDLSCGASDDDINNSVIYAYDIYSATRHRIRQRDEFENILRSGIFDENEIVSDGAAFKERYLSALGLRDKDFVKWLTRYLSNNLNNETKASSEKIVKAIEGLADTEKSLRESDQTKIDSLNETVSKLNELISSNTESNNQIKQAITSLTETYKQINKKADKKEQTSQDQYGEQDAKEPDEIIRDITPGSGDILDKIKNILKFKKAVILAGAPGTGKTTIARCIAKEITSGGITKADGTYSRQKPLKKYLEVVQFSAQYSYEDFVSGLKADENGSWTLTPGAFKSMCDKAQTDQKKKYVLIIDEINRANTEEVLGEMFNLMESRGIEITSRTGEKLVMPENLYIIATMNSIDRGAGYLDMATISRFAVVNIAAPSAEQMIKDVGKIPAIKDHPELKDDLKDKLRDKLIVAIGLIDDLNKLISEDKDAAVLNKDALKLGYRSLFSQDISQVDDINLIIEYDIKSDIDARQDKLSKETYEHCIEAIEAAIERDKPEERPADKAEKPAETVETVETGEQS